MRAVPLHWFTQNTGKTQRASNTLDSGLGVIVTYADYLTGIGMKLDAKGGGESGQQRINSTAPYRIYVQGSPDIVPTDRIVFSNRVFDVANVNNTDEIGVFTSCDCTEADPSDAAIVVSVAIQGSHPPDTANAVWTFGDAIASVGTVSGYQISTDGATWIDASSAGSPTGNHVALFYTNTGNPATPYWRAVSASGIVFTGGGTTVPNGQGVTI